MKSTKEHYILALKASHVLKKIRRENKEFTKKIPLHIKLLAKMQGITIKD